MGRREGGREGRSKGKEKKKGEREGGKEREEERRGRIKARREGGAGPQLGHGNGVDTDVHEGTLMTGTMESVLECELTALL